MAQTFLLIDGYNLMHAVGLARERYGPGDLERCRNQLLVWLKDHLSDSLHWRTTVVFDAIDSPRPGPTIERVHNFVVRFPSRGTEADELIEELILRHSAPKQILVVSSDHRLHKAIRKRKGRAVDSEEFVRSVSADTTGLNQPTTDAAHRATEKPKLKSPGENQEWLDAFGDISVEDIAAEIQAESTETEPVSLDSPDCVEPASATSHDVMDTEVSTEEDHFLAEVSKAINDVIVEENRGDYSDEISMWERRIAELSEEDD